MSSELELITVTTAESFFLGMNAVTFHTKVKMLVSFFVQREGGVT